MKEDLGEYEIIVFVTDGPEEVIGILEIEVFNVPPKAIGNIRTKILDFEE